MRCLINVALPDAVPCICGESCVGVIWWDGEGYADAACAQHLALFADTAHRIELGHRPTCREPDCTAPRMERQAVCREHLCARRRARYAESPSHQRARQLANGNTWRRDHGHAHRAQYLRAWRRANPEKALRSRTRQRARELGVSLTELPFSAEQLSQRLSMSPRCWLCGGPDPDTVEHVKPIAAGGAHALANLRRAHKLCNRLKADCWPLPAAARGLRQRAPQVPRRVLA